VRTSLLSGSASDPHRLNADPDPAFWVNVDSDPGSEMNTDPCGSGSWVPVYVKKINFQSQITELNFNEKKVSKTFLPITLIFICFMPKYLSFGCVFSLHFSCLPPRSGPRRPIECGSMRTQIRNTAFWALYLTVEREKKKINFCYYFLSSYRYRFQNSLKQWDALFQKFSG
jgi:hypothetical protein